MDEEIVQELDELEEIDYRSPDESFYVWEDRVTDALNTVIRYVKELAKERT